MQMPIGLGGSGQWTSGTRQSLEAVAANHVSGVLEMVGYDLPTAAKLLEIDLNELEHTIRRWNIAPDSVPQLKQKASV